MPTDHADRALKHLLHLLSEILTYEYCAFRWPLHRLQNRYTMLFFFFLKELLLKRQGVHWKHKTSIVRSGNGCARVGARVILGVAVKGLFPHITTPIGIRASTVVVEDKTKTSLHSISYCVALHKKKCSWCLHWLRWWCVQARQLGRELTTTKLEGVQISLGPIFSLTGKSCHCAVNCHFSASSVQDTMDSKTLCG